ncbi:eef1akmt3 [Symbiodinium pilosum]|uniref:Eef1akmt3 protein n=1 Tax=Symbiodinium pilosum TaxID=2952 RepID=A0A812XG65_SYMPI|nr:eef1akmt3 [Symbiodinium pilosum]
MSSSRIVAFAGTEWHLTYEDIREVLRPFLVNFRAQEQCRGLVGVQCQIVDLGCGTSTLGAAGVVRHSHDGSPSVRAAASEREARPARRCLPLAWTGAAELSEEEEAEDPVPMRSKKPMSEAWEARPFSRDSTASTLSAGRYRDEFGAWRPQTCSSQPSLPSTASASSSSARPSRSTYSRSDSFRSSATGSSHKRHEASKSSCRDKHVQPGAGTRELALNDVKLEDARQRASKSLEALQAKLRASRMPEMSKSQAPAPIDEDQPGQVQEAFESAIQIRPAWSERQRGAYGERDEGTASTALRSWIWTRACTTGSLTQAGRSFSGVFLSLPPLLSGGPEAGVELGLRMKEARVELYRSAASCRLPGGWVGLLLKVRITEKPPSQDVSESLVESLKVRIGVGPLGPEVLDILLSVIGHSTLRIHTSGAYRGELHGGRLSERTGMQKPFLTNVVMHTPTSQALAALRGIATLVIDKVQMLKAAASLLRTDGTEYSEPWQATVDGRGASVRVRGEVRLVSLLGAFSSRIVRLEDSVANAEDLELRAEVGVLHVGRELEPADVLQPKKAYLLQGEPMVLFNNPALSQAIMVEQEVEKNRSGEDCTGCIVWPSAHSMCAHLCAHPELVRGKRVVELGAGTGLVGLVCSALGAAEVVLTDLSQGLPLLQRNVQLNVGALGGAATRVAELRWGQQASIQVAPEGCDVVIGCEVIYQHDDETASALVATMRHLAGKDGSCLMAYEFRDGLVQDAVFFDAVNEVFEVSAQSLAPYGFGLSVEDSDDRLLYTYWAKVS